ncbi:EAL domain-containing protein [Terriglobus roseus]|uniref:PAS domain S-box-containing protein/diguanylate cyclase (GGDEF) domain-containing protein n=1 Tax=Terriglobus roseus TaxID=392734 RepID=A0A1H4K0Y6_9BACT|nr:EAL domain-containing protein [Terriglobus roseus]SEB51956.1 PAS domain S-box-containing protein/diguanylate cyclase (GGDEF) domain-containing protein [Terriglobus roseus]
MQTALALLEQRAHAGTWSLDISTGKLWWSEGVHRICGTDPKSYSPQLKRALGMFDSASRLVLQNAVDEATPDHKDFGVRVRLHRRDGESVSIFAAARPIFRDGILTSLSGVLYDLDAIARERSAALESEERFKMLFRDSPSGLILASINKQIILVNPALCSLLCFEEAELLQKTTTAITHPDDLDKTEDAVRRLWTGQVNNLSFEKRYLRSDGRPVWTRVSLSLLRDAERRPIHYIGQCLDISESKEREDELFEAKELAQITLSSIADGVIRTDKNGIVTLCNDAALRMLGYDSSAILGRPFWDVIVLHKPRGEDLLDDPVTEALNTGIAIKIPAFARLRTASGNMRPIFDSTAPVRSSSSEIVGAVFVFQDAADNLQMAERLTYQATHDALTGLPNRQAAEEQIKRVITLAKTAPGLCEHFLFYMDLDHFKVINDTCGHPAGDQVLREVSELIAERLRESDFLARFGGDEFVLILSSVSQESAAALARRLTEEISRYRFVSSSRSYSLSISIGIAQLGVAEEDVQDVLAQADTACYASKRSGRGTYQFFAFDDVLISETHVDLGWFQRIRRALSPESAPDSERLELYFQAIVDGDGKQLGSEALIRFITNEHKVISPQEFLPTAERMGLMGSLDRWVCKHAMHILALMEADPAVSNQIGGFISVNVSATTLSTPSFCEDLLLMLNARPTLGGRLRIEITESERGRWGADELQLLQRLRKVGVFVILDDFGSGYNSFHFLKLLQVDGLKLDKTVVNGLRIGPIDRNLAAAAIAIAKELQIIVTAEGVEDEETMQRLVALGVDHFQGYFFDRPHILRR